MARLLRDGATADRQKREKMLEKTWQRRLGTVTVRVVKGDPLEREADAVISPSNNLLEMGGGTSLALKEAGGEEIEMEARELSPVAVGAAVATGAGRLPFRAVVHSAICKKDGRISEDCLRISAFNALRRCSERSLSSVVFPVTAGDLGEINFHSCCKAVLEGLRDFCSEHTTTLREVQLVTPNEEEYRALASELERVAGKGS